MLIGNSLPEYLLIRIAVPALRLIAPLATVVGPAIFIARRYTIDQHRWLWPVGIWLVAEAGFFWGVYLPLRFILQKPARHPSPPSKEERQTLVERSLVDLPDPEHYLTKWFLNAAPQDIKRENVKEFYAWSFLNKRYEEATEEEEAELDDYVDQLEQKMGRALESGRGKAVPLRTTLDPVHMQHRPLLWYMIMLSVESGVALRFMYHGFSFRASSAFSARVAFPLGLHSLTRKISASSRIGYWYREHRSKSKTPIVFIHGIGIGYYTYGSFLVELSSSTTASANDESVGVIALELTSITSRLCVEAPSAVEVKDEIRKILDDHGWGKVVLVGHSYGTGVVATILRDKVFAKRIEATVLMDPICFMLHLPDVAYNFTRRLPRQANERMLHYFASQDMMISHTLARRFFWNQLILFKEDLPPNMSLAVTLSGRDLIVPTREVWKYLTGRPAPVSLKDNTGDTSWEEGNLRVHWFDKIDHAGVFATKGIRAGIAKETRKYCENRHRMSYA